MSSFDHRDTVLPDVTTEQSTAQVPAIDSVGMQGIAIPLHVLGKREDEQAFAKRNAENLMFFEDSVRRLHAAFSTYYQATYFRVKVEHQESLHAHDAIAEISGPVQR